MATVRVSDDLNQRLKERAKRDGVSATHLVATAIEALLDAPAGQPAPAKPRGRPSPSRVRRPRTTPGGSCAHPPGRRIGGVCMACGAKTS